MKSLKFFFFFSIIAFIGIGTINPSFAYENKQHQSMLKQLNDAINIDVVSRKMDIDNNGQALSVFTYTFTNKSQTAIKSIYWVASYVYEHEVLYSQYIQLDLSTPLMPGKEFSMNLQIPFSLIPEKSRSIFIDINKPIEMYSIDRTISFVDGKTLTER